MTMIHDINSRARKVSEMVLEAIGQRVRIVLTKQETNLAVHLRGNSDLHEALNELIRSRIQSRDSAAVPENPQDCKSILERNSELRWLLSRLDLLYRSPINTESEGEQPAA